MSGGREFVWNVRCAFCLAAEVGDELHCQTWAAAHRCPPSRTDDEWSGRARRFMQKVDVDPDGCWLWVGAISGERTVQLHRWSYEHFVGPIPDGLNIDHLCNDARCVNPQHLEPVTQSENLRRAAIRRGPIDHCQRAGHPYDEENTYVDPRGFRHCRACRAQKRSPLTPGDLPAETQPNR